MVVSDIRMPGMQGDELASVLKADPATAHLPVLLMSGHSHAGGESCDAFLSKPFVVADLLATVRRLARRGANDQSR